MRFKIEESEKEMKFRIKTHEDRIKIEREKYKVELETRLLQMKYVAIQH